MRRDDIAMSPIVFLLLFFLLVLCAGGTDPLSEVLSVLPVSEVQRRVFEEVEEKGASWLLIFHHGPRQELAYEAVDIIALAVWISRKFERLSLSGCSRGIL